MPIPTATLHTHRGEAIRNPSVGLVRAILADLPVDIFAKLILVYDVDDSDEVDGEPMMAVDRLPDGYRLFIQTTDAQLGSFPVDLATAGVALAAWTLGRDDWRTACEWRPSVEPDPAAKPELIRIAYEDNSTRTDCIGRYADGQFLAIGHGYLGCPDDQIAVALLLFDHDGNLTGSDIHTVPYVDWKRLRAEAVAALPEVSLGDVAVRPFSVEADGVRWELVDKSRPDMARFVMYPLFISFFHPFHGLYDT